MDWMTLAQSFPDLAEPVAITDACAKVLDYLVQAVSGALATFLGMSLLRGVVGMFGIRDRGLS